MPSRGSQKFIDKHFPYLQLTPEPHRMFQIAQLENIKKINCPKLIPEWPSKRQAL